MKHFHLQYEDVATSDWRTQTPNLNPRFYAISADSHVTEPPDAYARYIDPAFRDIAPKVVPNPAPGSTGDMYLAEGMPAWPCRVSAAAGMRPQDISLEKGVWADMHPGGFDSKARIEAQERDGILGEIIYPTVGMVLCGHPDANYMTACFRAYNRWIEEFVSENPGRLFGIGQSAARSPRDVIEDLHDIKKRGLYGVMLPTTPPSDLDYDAPEYDAVWKTAVELDLPISFHIVTGRSASALVKPPRGGKLAGFGTVLRDLQDVVGLFIFGGIFERHQGLRMVMVESDAGWIPHFTNRMDHAYKRHRFWMKAGGELKQLPSDYFQNHIYATFQDDWVALRNIDLLNERHLMWANDYPHSDSTWPWSHELLAHHMAQLTDRQVDLVLRENVKALYKLDIDTSVANVPAPA